MIIFSFICSEVLNWTFSLIVNKSLFKTKKTSYIMNWMKIKLKNVFLPSKHLSQFSCLRLEIHKKMTRQGSARDVWNISYIVCLKLLFDYFFINFLTIMQILVDPKSYKSSTMWPNNQFKFEFHSWNPTKYFNRILT